VRLPLARGAPAGLEHAEAHAAAVPGHVRVVVADDNRDAADSLQRILSLFGHEVRVAYDGVAAIRLAEEFRPRVAVLDIGMPGTSGYEVARTLRERRITPITLVALTGWGQESDRTRAMEAGFDYHLTKPVDPEALNRLFDDVAKNS
jgi:CheY-like chemotaxis protein